MVAKVCVRLGEYLPSRHTCIFSVVCVCVCVFVCCVCVVCVCVFHFVCVYVCMCVCVWGVGLNSFDWTQAKRFRELTTPHNIYKLGSKEDPNFDPQTALEHGMEAAQTKVSACG